MPRWSACFASATAGARPFVLGSESRTVVQPERRAGSCRARDHQCQERRPDPVAWIPAETLAPRRAEQCHQTASGRELRPALEAILLAGAVRSVAARAALLVLGG